MESQDRQRGVSGSSAAGVRIVTQNVRIVTKNVRIVTQDVRIVSDWTQVGHPEKLFSSDPQPPVLRCAHAVSAQIRHSPDESLS